MLAADEAGLEGADVVPSVAPELADLAAADGAPGGDPSDVVEAEAAHLLRVLAAVGDRVHGVGGHGVYFPGRGVRGSG